MDLLPEPLPIIDVREEAYIRASQQLQDVLKVLQEERKVLRRDWDQLSPRERSTQSRVVKELEGKKRALEEEIEMNSAT